MHKPKLTEASTMHCTPEEKEFLAVVADIEGTTASEYLRGLLCADRDKRLAQAARIHKFHFSGVQATELQEP